MAKVPLHQARKPPRPAGRPVLKQADLSAPPATASADDAHAAALAKAGLSGGMLALQKQLNDRFLPAGGAAAFAVAPGMVGPDNISGSYVGLVQKDGRFTGQLGVVVTVKAKQAEGAIPPHLLVPREESVGGEKVRVDVRPVGNVVAQQGFTLPESPARYGASVGLPGKPTGSLGCLVATAGNDLCLLSNNHVLADLNRAAIHSPVVQPGAADAPAGDVVGFLSRFHPLNLSNFGASAPNRVDAALAFTSFTACVPELHGGTPFSGEPADAALFMAVLKEGRTTGPTLGMVAGLNATQTWGYGSATNPAPFGTFTGQIVLQGVQGPFSGPGDSGSLILGQVGGEFRPVGLLAAGNTETGITWANPIRLVMDALDIARILDPSFPIE